MSKKKDSDYVVGFKKPPRHTQFKPGQSGNAKGRPKKNTTLVDAFLKELGTSVTITLGSRTKKVLMTEIIAKQIINGAAKGDAKSTALLLRVLKPVAGDQGNNLPDLLREFRSKNLHLQSSETKTSEPPSEDPRSPLATSPIDRPDGGPR